MTKIKTVYDKLLPDVKTELQSSARQYSSAKRLKYTLMSKTMWHELTIDEMRDLLTYGNLSTYKMEPFSFMYGDNILTK